MTDTPAHSGGVMSGLKNPKTPGQWIKWLGAALIALALIWMMI